MFSQWELETFPLETTGLCSPGTQWNAMTENVIVLNTFGSLTTTDRSMYKMDIQTSCIFVPSIPDILLTPQKEMYIQELMGLLKGDFPPPQYHISFQPSQWHGKLIISLLMDPTEPLGAGAALKVLGKRPELLFPGLFQLSEVNGWINPLCLGSRNTADFSKNFFMHENLRII